MNRACPNCAMCTNAECKRRKLAPIAADADIAIVAAPDKSAVIVDIGTTTIIFAYIAGGRVVNTYSAVNPQRAAGLDVISRIQAAASGRAATLKRLVCDAVKHGVYAVTGGADADIAVISANTTMVHLALGLDVSGMGSFPFTPAALSYPETTLAALVGYPKPIPAYIVPSVSAFIGGDIVAGLYLCGYATEEQKALFMDLGTNGEIAVTSGDSIYASSASAGPAFEGGGISAGTAAVDGAVSGVNIFYYHDLTKRREDRFYFENHDYILELETIANKPPKGICGSGIIELTAELVRNGIIDDTGLLSHRYFEDGFRFCESGTFTQKDIREYQLAKGAVRAACEILLKRAGLAWEDLDTVYIAGGFSHSLNPKKAARAGLLPISAAKCVRTVGNTSLAGAAMLAFDDEGAAAIKAICDKTTMVELPADENFNEEYLNQMGF